MSQIVHIERIKALLLKARPDSGSTPDEQNSCRNMAYKLMKKHNITKEMIIGTTKSIPKDDSKFRSLRFPHWMYDYEPWKEYIAKNSRIRNVYYDKSLRLYHAYVYGTQEDFDKVFITYLIIRNRGIAESFDRDYIKRSMYDTKKILEEAEKERKMKKKRKEAITVLAFIVINMLITITALILTL